MKLSDFVLEEAIVPDMQSVDRDAVVGELVDALIAAGAAPESLRDELIKKVLTREKRGSTGFGKGVAVPHVKHADVDKMSAAVGVSQKGVDFNALDKAPVYSVILLLSPEDKPEEHLQAMNNVFTNLQKDTFRRFLRQATTVQDVTELLHEADTHQIQ